MSKRSHNLIFSIFLLFVSLSGVAADADEYKHALSTFRSTPGTAELFSQAAGYALFPTIGKGGIGLGGAYGEGRVYQHGKLLGTSNMVQVTLGFQLGGQAYSQIIFFKDQRAIDEFTSGNFEFGAEANAVALTAAASAQAGTTGASAGAGLEQHSNESVARWYKGMAALTITKGGLMYQATLGGQKFSFKPINADGQ